MRKDTQSNQVHHHCDSHSLNARIVIMFGGATAVLLAGAMVVYCFIAKPMEALALTTLVGALTTVMTGMFALLGRVGSQTPSGTQDVNVTNPASEPVPVEEKEKR